MLSLDWQVGDKPIARQTITATSLLSPVLRQPSSPCSGTLLPSRVVHSNCCGRSYREAHRSRRQVTEVFEALIFDESDVLDEVVMGYW